METSLIHSLTKYRLAEEPANIGLLFMKQKGNANSFTPVSTKQLQTATACALYIVYFQYNSQNSKKAKHRKFHLRNWTNVTSIIPFLSVYFHRL